MKRKSSVYLKLLLSYLGILIIPILVALGIYGRAWQVIRTQTARINENLLYMVQKEIDSEIKNIHKIESRLALDNMIQNLSKKREGHFDLKDQQSLYYLYTDLRMIDVAESFLNHIFVYFPGTEKISSSLGNMDMSLYYNLYYKDESMSLDQFREYMTSRRYNDILEIKDSSGQELLIFTMSTLNANTGESPATIGIVVDESQFRQKLLFGKWDEQVHIRMPLSELVKIEPKAIGVGQYQHDMNQKQLSGALTGVVEATVNKVGVDLNTASASLLEYVSGVSKAVAKNIVSYREENGKFLNRRELLKVAKLGPKAYEQCAGFLRISGGKNPLDATGVHPETYKETDQLLQSLGYSVKELSSQGFQDIGKKITDYQRLSEELGVGEITLRDIVKELEKPGRDPREDMPKPILRTDVMEMEDLKEGMKLKGTVRNVIDFGAFVDIGVHQDGLVHISQMADRFVKHPLEVVSVGDVVDVTVLSVDLEKKRIQLSMRKP